MTTQIIDSDTLAHISQGYDKIASRSHSLHADCYQHQRFLNLERQQIFHKSWQFLCHEEKLAQPESYVAAEIQGQASSHAETEAANCERSTTSASTEVINCFRVAVRQESLPALITPGSTAWTAASPAPGVRNSLKTSILKKSVWTR